MPALTITTVDGKAKRIDDTASLEAEIDRFEEALQALIPDLEGDDDEAGNHAIGLYRVLSYNLDAILSKVEWWNEQVNNERRAARQTLASELKSRRRKVLKTPPTA